MREVTERAVVRMVEDLYDEPNHVEVINTMPFGSQQMFEVRVYPESDEPTFEITVAIEIKENRA